MAEKKISLGLLTVYDVEIKNWVKDGNEQVLADAKEHAKGLVDGITEGVIAESTVAIEKLGKDIGNLDNLGTTSKEDLVSAINEVKNSVSAGGEAAAITVDASSTTEGALKSYTIKQGGNVITTIDIPKDMVVESGTVVENPEGKAAGTYIKLVLANVAEPLFINVGTLVDIYTAEANATQIQLTINSSTREIGATIVAGSVGTAELAAGAITTEKIADGNITLSKLSTTVQESLGKADTSVQSIAEGGTNGTLAIDGVEVPVHGLGSAAFTGADAYDPAGSAKAVDDKVTALDERVAEAEGDLEKLQENLDQQIGSHTHSWNDLLDKPFSEDGETIKTLDEKFIPDSIARTEVVNDHETRIAALEAAEWATEADILAMFGK